MTKELELLMKEQQEALDKEKECYYKVQVRLKMDNTPGKLEPLYEDQVQVARFVCGFPGDDIEGDNALKLIGLLCNLTQLYRKETPTVKPAQVLAKAWGAPSTPGVTKMYKQLSILCELFITPKAKFSYYGCKTVEEMLSEVNKIMDLWLPF